MWRERRYIPVTQRRHRDETEIKELQHPVRGVDQLFQSSESTWLEMFNQAVDKRKPNPDHQIDVDRAQYQLRRHGMAAQHNIAQQHATDPEQE